jgi:hypothetical protein
MFIGNFGTSQLTVGTTSKHQIYNYLLVTNTQTFIGLVE